jgi:anti-anti-sigma factor
VGEPWGLRVSGEVDVSNRDLLHRLLVSRAAVTPRLRVDLSGLTFADVGTVTRLRAIADALPEGGWLALDRVPDLVRRVLDVTGLGHERMRLEP